jgi:hypothetical protein
MRKHEEMEQLLPWLANGTLAEGEREELERHLAACPVCGGELAREQALAGALRAAGEIAPSPHPAQLARLLARLDQPAAEPAPARRREFTPRLRRLAAGTPVPVRWALAAQLAVVVLLLATGDWRPEPPAAPEAAGQAAATFHTLSDPVSPTPSSGLRLRVVVAEETTEHELRALLHTIGGRLVDGPSPLGVYTLEVPSGPAADPPEVVLQHLTAHPRVRFAAPAAGSGGP